MYKRIAAVLLLFVLLTALLPMPVRAAELVGESKADYCNSDTEAARDGVCWYVDTMNGNRLVSSRLVTEAEAREGLYDSEFVIEALTDYPVEQLLLWEDQLLVSAGERLLRLDPESGKQLQITEFAAPVDRFAVSTAGLYVLTGGKVLLLNGQKQTTVISDADRFWLETPDRLCYMQDEQSICTLELSTGLVCVSPNNASNLEDREGDEACGMSLSALKQKFPHGKYWNHMPKKGTGMTYNNQDGWTNLACIKHNNYCGTYLQTCNGYAPCGEEISYQCWGFADKLGHDASGRDPQSHDQGNGWTKLWYSSSLNNLKAGDIIRYNKNGDSRYAHSIYVTGVSGDTITYADCNYNGTCIIRWGQTISKATVKRWFVFLLSAPAAAAWEPNYLLNVNARLDGCDAADTAGWAVFDVWINGKVYKTGVSECRGYWVKGTKYEVKNVRPVSGVMFDQTAGSALSGSLTSNCELILTLDHYWINSEGKKIKTTLTDLPDQSKWSYRPICWALEHGVASGLSPTCFGPGAYSSRAQAMTFLWVLCGRLEPEGSDTVFTDVSPDSYYFKPVLWAVEQGITAGKTEDCFRPRSNCSRAEVVTFLWSLAGKPIPAILAENETEPIGEPEPGETPAEPEPLPNLSPFTDVDPEHYYYTPVLWAVENGIAAGVSPASFAPKKACTRAEILTFLYNYWKKMT